MSSERRYALIGHTHASGGAVDSVFGRTGAVVATAGDYDAFYYTEAEIDTTLANLANWDTAFGWGDHGTAGYLSNVVEDTTPQFSSDLNLITGADLYIWDSTDADYGRFYHDGADLNLALQNAVNFDISGGTKVNLNGMYLQINGLGTAAAHPIDWYVDEAAANRAVMRFYDATSTKQWQATLTTAGAMQWLDSSNNIFMQWDQGSRIRMRDGIALRMYGPSDSAYVDYDSGDTNQTVTYSGITHANHAGLSGAFWIRDGATLRVSDSTDADYIDTYHDGTSAYREFNQTQYDRTVMDGTTSGSAWTDGGLFKFWIDKSNSRIQIHDGYTLRISDTDDTDYVDMSHDAAGGIMHYNHVNTSQAVFELAGTDYFVIDFTNDRIISYSPMFMQEQAAANSDSAGFGQFWVKNDAPNTPWFTDDGGTDQLIDPSVSEIEGKTASYTMVLGDKGKTIRFTGATASKVCTIPANASVAFPVGTMIGITNDGSVTMTVAITTDTLTWGKDNTTGTRTLAAGADCVIHKVSSTGWKINGSALVT